MLFHIQQQWRDLAEAILGQKTYSKTHLIIIMAGRLINVL